MFGGMIRLVLDRNRGPDTHVMKKYSNLYVSQPPSGWN